VNCALRTHRHTRDIPEAIEACRRPRRAPEADPPARRPGRVFKAFLANPGPGGSDNAATPNRSARPGLRTRLPGAVTSRNPSWLVGPAPSDQPDLLNRRGRDLLATESGLPGRQRVRRVEDRLSCAACRWRWPWLPPAPPPRLHAHALARNSATPEQPGRVLQRRPRHGPRACSRGLPAAFDDAPACSAVGPHSGPDISTRARPASACAGVEGPYAPRRTGPSPADRSAPRPAGSRSTTC